MRIEKTPPVEDTMFTWPGEVRVSLRRKARKAEIEVFDRALGVVAARDHSFEGRIKAAGVEERARRALAEVWARAEAAGWRWVGERRRWEKPPPKEYAAKVAHWASKGFAVDYGGLPTKFTEDLAPGAPQWFAAKVLEALHLARFFRKDEKGNCQIDGAMSQAYMLGVYDVWGALVKEWNPAARRGKATKEAARKGGKRKSEIIAEKMKERRAAYDEVRARRREVSHRGVCVLVAEKLKLKDWRYIDRAVKRKEV